MLLNYFRKASSIHTFIARGRIIWGSVTSELGVMDESIEL